MNKSIGTLVVMAGCLFVIVLSILAGLFQPEGCAKPAVCWTLGIICVLMLIWLTRAFLEERLDEARHILAKRLEEIQLGPEYQTEQD